jgi:hypothetical protein
MSELAKLQADFQAYLYDDLKGAAFKHAIINDKKVGATKRLGIYYDAYRLRIIEALANVYPNLKKLLGDDLFDSTARSYIDDYPSTFRNMRWVGDKMAEHLRKTLRQHPIAAEMATFEWALGLAFDAEDVPILTLQDLALIPPQDWGGLRFKFQPAVQLLSSTYNVLHFWQALNIDEAPPTVTQINEHYVVWRKDLNPHYRSLEPAEYAAIQQMMAGASFADLCETLQQNASQEVADDSAENNSMAQAAQYLAGRLNEGLLTALY